MIHRRYDRRRGRPSDRLFALPSAAAAPASARQPVTDDDSDWQPVVRSPIIDRSNSALEPNNPSTVANCSLSLATTLPVLGSLPQRVITLLLISLLTGGCGQVKDDAKRIALENTLSSYRQAIRWGYFPAAAGFVSPDQRTDLDSKHLENVRVTGYEVIQPGVIGRDDTAVQLVQIQYVLEDRQRLEQVADRQRWRYDPITEAWWLESGLPSFEAPLR